MAAAAAVDGLTLEAIRSFLLSEGILNKAQTLARSQFTVGDIVRDGDEYSATIFAGITTGTSVQRPAPAKKPATYRTSIVIATATNGDKFVLSGKCTCKSTDNCSHMGAILLKVSNNISAMPVPLPSSLPENSAPRQHLKPSPGAASLDMRATLPSGFWVNGVNMPGPESDHAAGPAGAQTLQERQWFRDDLPPARDYSFEVPIHEFAANVFDFGSWTWATGSKRGGSADNLRRMMMQCPRHPACFYPYFSGNGSEIAKHPHRIESTTYVPFPHRSNVHD